MPTPGRPRTRRLDRPLAWICWTYAALTLSALAFLYLAGDRWWPASFLLFGPRWVLALPLAVLLPPALWRRRLLPPLLLAAAVVFGPLMGLHWSLSAPRPPEGGTVVRVLTCNVRAGQCDIRALTALMLERNVDLAALQECPFWVLQDLPRDWHKVRTESVVVLSRHPLRPLDPIRSGRGADGWPSVGLLPCVVDLPRGELLFHSVYLPSAHYGLQRVLDRRTGLDLRRTGLLVAEIANRRAVSRDMRRAVGAETLPLVLAGDFNLPPESTIYRENWADLPDAFARTGRGYGWTYRDTPLGLPLAVRIDHVLTGNGAVPLSCEVGPDVGSDHRPIIADIFVP